MTQIQLIYLVSVGLLGPLAITLIYQTIKRLERSSRNRMEERSAIKAVETTTPHDDGAHRIRQSALANIATRFTIVENFTVVLLVLIWLGLLIFPFLETMPQTVISIVAGSLAVIVGITARPFLENFFAGILITLSKPFRIGDTVLMEGNYGTIEDITLSHTIVKIWDWRRYVIPNSKMINKEFVNYTWKDNHLWVKVEFRVAYDTDLDQLRELALAAARRSDYFVPYEAPSFWLMDLEKEAYRCWVAAWSDSPARAWELGNDIRSNLLRDFQRHDIRAHQFNIRNAPPAADS